MKIVITGGNGQLGQELARVFGDLNTTVVSFSKLNLDITNKVEVNSVLFGLKPDWLINCAAFTNVDLAQKKITESNLVNGFGPGFLAEALFALNAKMLHISTDAVFSSDTPRYFEEFDKTKPINQYGVSKVIGEQMALNNHPDNCWIIRTAWLYGSYGGKFVNKILSDIQKDKDLYVTTDQYGQPTRCKDLAYFISRFIFSPPEQKIHHFSNNDFVSRFDFAKKILDYFPASKSKITGVVTQFNENLAPRAKYSLLKLSQSIETYKIEPMNWQDSLEKHLDSRFK